MELVMKKIVFLLCAMFFAWACYEDKGNYDYREINQITIQGIDTLIRCDQMDLLSIPVTLEGTQYADTNRFSYLWEVNREAVATTKDLNIYANFPLGENTGRFIVTDKDLGTKAFWNFRINVASSTAGDGILVLSKYHGHAELSFKRLDKEGSVFTPNYYEAIAGHQLGNEPRKIHRNYRPESDNNNSSLLIETDYFLKSFDAETLLETGENKYLDAYFFMSSAMEWQPGVTDFKVQTCLHLPAKMMMFDVGYVYIIANDALWACHTVNMAPMGGGYTRASNLPAKKSPRDGALSPVVFMPEWTENSKRDLAYVFDETYGHFLKAPSSGNLVDCPDLGEYPGYKLVYGTHTSAANYSVAVLSNGTQYKMLYLKLSSPQSVVGEVEVPAGVMNETTSYYPVRTEPYLFFATADKLYRYNLRELENGIVPGSKDVVLDLANFKDEKGVGYEGDVQITCMTVSRTEQEIVLGVSRYGGDEEAMSDELKGDVLVLKLDDRSLIRKYSGIAGRPVDVMIKYQKYLWGGREGGKVVDELYW